MTSFSSAHDSQSLNRSASLLAQQVQWKAPTLVDSGIDQTRLVIADAPTDATPFSFMVMGDTDAGTLPTGKTTCSTKGAKGAKQGVGTGELATFSHAFARQLTAQLGDSRFLLHTGDVTYPMGTYQNYLSGFLEPYQSLLSLLPKGPRYNSRSVIFNRPLLPIPGNHDYADLIGFARTRQQCLTFVCDRLRQLFKLDFGCYGGQGGEAYGQTFLDTLAKLSPEQLKHHLAAHYSAQSHIQNNSDNNADYCLNYQPGQFTRLPNRYYQFRYAGVDFFALDSNTWNTAPEDKNFDHAQLAWLEKSLLTSWKTPGTVGRILYLHHSPYTTESTRWQQPETLWVRRHLRSVLDRVKADCPDCPPDIPLLDVVISGHSHCLEHVRTTETGHADAHMDWVVCGGSGLSLRQQRKSDTTDILEKVSPHNDTGNRGYTSVVATSQLYAGTHLRRNQKQRFHSFIRIQVTPHQSQRFTVCPFVVNQTPQGWRTKALSPLAIGHVGYNAPLKQLM